MVEENELIIMLQNLKNKDRIFTDEEISKVAPYILNRFVALYDIKLANEYNQYTFMDTRFFYYLLYSS